MYSPKGFEQCNALGMVLVPVMIVGGIIGGYDIKVYISYKIWLIFVHCVCQISVLYVIWAHWNGNVFIMKFSSLATLEVVKMTTSSAASD